jgi:hypothetical protein
MFAVIWLVAAFIGVPNVESVFVVIAILSCCIDSGRSIQKVLIWSALCAVENLIRHNKTKPCYSILKRFYTNDFFLLGSGCFLIFLCLNGQVPFFDGEYGIAL